VKPLYVQMLAPDGTHAGRPGEPRFALCGAYGTSLLVRVTGAFDVTCSVCARMVVAALGLTPLSDPTNVKFVVVDEEEAHDGSVNGAIFEETK